MQAMQQAAYFPTAMGMSPYSHFPLQPGVQQLTAATHQHKAKAKGGGSAGGEGSNGVEVSRENQLQCFFIENQQSPVPDLGTSIDLKSADKELKAVTPEKSKTCVTAFTKKLVTTLQL